MPDYDIPDNGLYLWSWYWEASNGSRRDSEGVAQPLSWNEFLAWQTLTGHIVYPFEFDILRDMDVAFCEAKNIELVASRVIAEEMAKREAGERGGGA